MNKKFRKNISIILFILLLIFLLFFLNENVTSINFEGYRLNDIDEITWNTLNGRKSDFKYLLPLNGDRNLYKSAIVTFSVENRSSEKNIFWLDYEIKFPKDNKTIAAYSLPITNFREIPPNNIIRYSINLIIEDNGNIDDELSKLKFSFKSLLKKHFFFGYNCSTARVVSSK